MGDKHTRTAVEDAVDQPERAVVADAVGQLVAQDGQVDGGKELVDVALQDIRIATGEVLAAVKRLVRALVLPAGVGVVDEAGLPDRVKHATERVMHDAGRRKGAALINRSLRSRM